MTHVEIKPVNLKIGDQLLHNYPYNSTRQIYFTSGPSNKLDAAEEWLRRKRAGYETYIRHEAGAVILYYDGLSRKNAEIISISCLGTADDYVYDLETESGRFQAGIGEMIVKNTDSCMLKFSNVHKLKECFELCKEMEKVINSIFPKPMYLELEKIYSKYFLLSKKRYVGYIVDLEGNIIDIDKKGVVIKRRDNCAYLREIYSQIIDMVMAKEPRWKMFEYLRVKIDDLLKGNVDLEKLVITKSIKDTYKTQNLPHVAGLPRFLLEVPFGTQQAFRPEGPRRDWSGLSCFAWPKHSHIPVVNAVGYNVNPHAKVVPVKWYGIAVPN
ncbi:hypothetical protein LCGC14_2907550, partial [marine sediment metagenome]